MRYTSFYAIIEFEKNKELSIGYKHVYVKTHDLTQPESVLVFLYQFESLWNGNEFASPNTDIIYTYSIDIVEYRAEDYKFTLYWNRKKERGAIYHDLSLSR